jgi:hypothetical protein
MKFRFIEDRRATRPTGQFKRQERTHRWIKLGGKVNADEVRKSNERRKIVAALKEASDEITPTAIAKLTRA